MSWGIALLCVVAAGMSLWLSVQKWTGQIDSLAGCGAGSGCANVLGSKWSLVWGVIPVSVFSFLLYVSILLTLGLSGFWVRWYRSWVAWMCLWAALWFTGVQVIELKTICPYCMTMHGLGVGLGVILLLSEGWRLKTKGAFLSMVCGAACVVGLAMVQAWGPEPLTYREDVVEVAREVASEKADIHARGDGRLIEFLSGRKSYRVSELPHLGSAKAPYVMVEYFDYSCEACREMHGLLEGAVARYPDQLAVIVLPIPLNRGCNSHLPEGVKDQKSACELAQLSLVVWRANPEKFPEFHQSLFDLQGMPYELAESLAVSLVGADVLAFPENRSWAVAVLAQNVKDYRWLIEKTPVMPKLLMGDSVLIQGAVNDEVALQELLSKYFGLR